MLRISKPWCVAFATLCCQLIVPRVGGAQAPPRSEACMLTSVSVPVSPPAALLALGPEYFHSATRGAFLDRAGGASRPTYYDPADPTAPGALPAGVSRIDVVTEHFAVGNADDGSGVVVVDRRPGGTAHTLVGSVGVRVAGAAETGQAGLWVVGQRAGTIVVLRADAGRPPVSVQAIPVTTDSTPSLVIVATRVGEVFVAWSTAGPAGRLEVRGAWLDRARGTLRSVRTLDSMVLPAPLADLSLRTGLNLVVGPDGSGVSVAWRPLTTPPQPLDTGTPSRPPSTSFPAAVRIVHVSADGAAQSPTSFPTLVRPLMGTTGLGPWPLDGGGMWAFAVDGHATVAWIDASGDTLAARLVAHRVGQTGVTVLAPDADDALLAVRTSAGPRAHAYLYQGGHVRQYEIGCAPASASPRP